MEMTKEEQHLRKQIAEQLDLNFGHLDFWRLSKDWKKLTYQQVANRLIWIIREHDKYYDK